MGPVRTSDTPLSQYDAHSAPKSSADIAESRRFRWRIIPVAIVGGFGLIYSAFGGIGLFLATYSAIASRPFFGPGPEGPEAAAFGVMAIGAGAWIIVAAVQLQKGQWLRAIVLIFVLIILGQADVELGLIRD